MNGIHESKHKTSSEVEASDVQDDVFPVANGGGNVKRKSGSSSVQLKRNVTLWNGVSIILGVMIGSGIFVSPRGVLEETGSIGGSLLVWSLCGLLALLGALCFAELGTSISSSGGEYTYIKLAYGPLPSFLYLWVLVVVILPCSNAVASLTFAKYSLQPLYVGCEPPENAVRLLAFAILLFLGYINCASVNSSIKLQNSFTLTKVASLMLIILYGAYYVFTNQAPALYSQKSIWENTQTSLPHLAKAFYSAFYTYSGWNSLNTLTEEIQNPRKNIPRSIVISLSSITLIYILANTAYFAILSKEEILSSDAIAVLFGDKVLTFAKWLMPLLVALSTMGGLNGSIFASSRILFAGARSGQLFSALSMIHIENLTPIPAIIFLTSVSSLYLTTTKILDLINYVTFIEATFATLGVSTVLVLRRKMPDLARPLKVAWLIPVIYLCFSVLLILLPIWTSTRDALVGFLILLLGVPVYYTTAGWRRKPKFYQETIDRFNLVVQKVTNSVVPSSDMDIIL